MSVGRVVTALLVLAASTARAFELEQLTCVPPGCEIRGAPVLSASGRRLVLRSTCDLDRGRNPRGREQLFLLDLESRHLRQLTRSGRDCTFDVASDAAGERLVAVARCGGTEKRPPRSRLLECRGGGPFRPLGGWVRCAIGFTPGALSADGDHVGLTAACAPGGGGRPQRRLALYLRDAGSQRFRRLGHPACDILDASLSADGQVVAFISNCDLAGENPWHYFQIFRWDRQSGRALQLTRVLPHTGCALIEPLGAGIFEPPAVSADGYRVGVGAACVDATRQSFVLDSAALFRWGPDARPERLTADYCAGGVSAIDNPVGLSADGRVIAFTLACGALVSGERTARVLVYRDDPHPHVGEVLVHAGHGVFRVSRASLDATGSSLAIVADVPLGGCLANGAGQVYLARRLEEPAPARPVCACGAAP